MAISPLENIEVGYKLKNWQLVKVGLEELLGRPIESVVTQKDTVPTLLPPIKDPNTYEAKALVERLNSINAGGTTDLIWRQEPIVQEEQHHDGAVILELPKTNSVASLTQPTFKNEDDDDDLEDTPIEPINELDKFKVAPAKVRKIITDEGEEVTVCRKEEFVPGLKNKFVDDKTQELDSLEFDQKVTAKIRPTARDRPGIESGVSVVNCSSCGREITMENYEVAIRSSSLEAMSNICKTCVKRSRRE